ncbi:VOC family protein [Streptomyces sp. NPDC056188]|uniref:VOC family protein n=1 Tax=Streptomyces sp. NPDC056188 TaxID=3345740 RepID=UPI0035DE3E31
MTSFYGVTFDCPDPARLAEFYRQLTGMTVSYSSDDYADLSGEGVGHRLPARCRLPGAEVALTAGS